MINGGKKGGGEVGGRGGGGEEGGRGGGVGGRRGRGGGVGGRRREVNSKYIRLILKTNLCSIHASSTRSNQTMAKYLTILVGYLMKYGLVQTPLLALSSLKASFMTLCDRNIA